MLLTDQKAQHNTVATPQNQPKTQLKATWVIENNRLVCKWLTA